jgi:hypothetical protein
MGFCEVADLEGFLQVTIPPAKFASAERAIEGATVAIKSYCRQQLELVQNDVITLDSIGAAMLLLPELPVVSVATVVEDGTTLTVTTDYKLGQYGMLHRINARWAKGIQIVAITYTHGYRLSGSVGDPLPDVIVEVCTRAAARAYQAGLRAEENEGVPGVQAHSLGDYSVQFGAEQAQAGEAVLGASAAPMLLRSEKDMLRDYRV